MLLLTCLLLQQPLVERVAFPTAAERAKFPDAEKILKVVLDREVWTESIKFLEENLGPFGADWTVAVTLDEWAGPALARGARTGKAATVRFNVRRLLEYEKKAVGTKWKVAPLRYDRLVRHELAHVLQGEYESFPWFTEGIAAWAGDDPNYIDGYLHSGPKIRPIDVPSAEGEEYARGHLFMKWLELKAGRAAMKALVERTFRANGTAIDALEEILKMEWKDIRMAEHTWAMMYKP